MENVGAICLVRENLEMDIEPSLIFSTVMLTQVATQVECHAEVFDLP